MSIRSVSIYTVSTSLLLLILSTSEVFLNERYIFVLHIFILCLGTLVLHDVFTQPIFLTAS